MLHNSGQDILDLDGEMKIFKNIVNQKNLNKNFIPNSFCGHLDDSKEEEHHDCDECALNSGTGDLQRYLQIFIFFQYFFSFFFKNYLRNDCHRLATCYNTHGSYSCACTTTGYEGNGKYCSNIDECYRANSCSGAGTICTVTGSTHCQAGKF